jgi:hypothetical protein
MVSSSVVHTMGAWYCTNGGRFTARGIAAPVRPPTVCLNVTRSAATTGLLQRSGSLIAGIVIEPMPRSTVVAPMIPAPQ